MELVNEIVIAFLAMAPYLIFGFLFAGILHVFIKKEFILKHFGKRSAGSVIRASVLGVPLPLCSCSVIPTALSLKRDKASNPAILSFLVSTPLTGVDSIVATYGVLGPVFAIFRPIAAFLMGIISGIAALFIHTERKGEDGHPNATSKESCCSSNKESEEKASCCCSERPEVKKVTQESCCEGEAVDTKESCCSTKTVETDCGCSGTDNKKGVLRRIYDYAFITLLDDIALPLIIGIIISGIMAWIIPENFFADLAVPYVIQMLIIIAAAVPVYVCATASLPIGAVLLMKGLSPGLVFVFLAAGPVSNSATIALIVKEFGRRFFMVYFFSIALLSMGFGYLLDLIVEYGAFTIALSEHMGHDNDSDVIAVASGIFLGVMLLGSLKRKYIDPKIGGGVSGGCCSN